MERFQYLEKKTDPDQSRIILSSLHIVFISLFPPTLVHRLTLTGIGLHKALMPITKEAHS